MDSILKTIGIGPKLAGDDMSHKVKLGNLTQLLALTEKTILKGFAFGFD